MMVGRRLLAPWMALIIFFGGCVNPNRLIREKSPYLLQHAYNPVEWYPWGEEAFAKAKKEDKPIFLSIGYSTCHWCHVMERESFSNPEIAALMNKHFVSIKVDREERPDVDGLYMQAVMAMTGQGGWPLSAFLTPERKPFFGGTYFPPENRWGRPGFKTVLQGVAENWANKRAELLLSSDQLTQALQAQDKEGVPGAAPMTIGLLERVTQMFSSSFDETYGGFGSAPKFPRSHALSLLLRSWKHSQDPELLKMVEATLKGMAAGGMYDHLGGGFHRYSTDQKWHVPHFEKMLYDQALLAKTYLEAYQATGKPEYAMVAREIFEYLLRDMTSPEGGFYSAEDADSAMDPAHPEQKGEGIFYLWSQKEIEGVLGDDQAKLFNFLYGVEPVGNAESDPTGEFKGKNILFRAHTVEEAAKEFQITPEEVKRRLDEAKATLFKVRGQRPRPYLDDKILVDWNGLMISSLAFGSRVLDEPRYREAADKAARFILQQLVKEGRLLHRYREGDAGLLGTLEDYAFFIHGLIDLYEATFDPLYLDQAKKLTHEMIRLFWDEKNGGFFLTGTDAEKLLVRQKEVYDGAIPSGNSVAALDLLRVGRLTMAKDLEEKAELLMQAFSEQVHHNPEISPQLLIALDFALGPSFEIVVAGSEELPETQQMVKVIYSLFIPNKVVALHASGPSGQAIEALVPFLKEQVALGGKATAYVCENYTCNRPVTSAEELRHDLSSYEMKRRE